jgi:hypothetical protein
MHEIRPPEENANHWRPLKFGRIGMLQWKTRFIVLATSLTLIASAFGGFLRGFGPIHYGW